LQFWKFNNAESNQALDEYVTDPNWKDNISENWNINKIKLNSYGDKIAVNDIDGNLYLFSLGQNFNEPNIILKKATFMETLDFAYLNQGTVICTTGIRPSSHLTIYDTLMPPEKSAIVRENIGGNNIVCLQENKQVLIFSNKEPGMNIYDIRMHKFFDQFVFFFIYEDIKLPEENVTAATVNNEQDTLITGHEEGSIKVWDIGLGYALREKLTAFEASKQKVKQVVVTHENSLYAVGSDGIFDEQNMTKKGYVKLMRAFV